MSSGYSYHAKYLFRLSFCMEHRLFSPLVIAEDQTPRFLDAPQDTEILSGDPVRFQCRVEGEPFPTVAFYRVKSFVLAVLHLTDPLIVAGRWARESEWQTFPFDPRRRCLYTTVIRSSARRQRSIRGGSREFCGKRKYPLHIDGHTTRSWWQEGLDCRWS